MESQALVIRDPRLHNCVRMPARALVASLKAAFCIRKVIAQLVIVGLFTHRTVHISHTRLSLRLRCKGHYMCSQGESLEHQWHHFQDKQTLQR